MGIAIENEVIVKGRRAKEASRILNQKTTVDKEHVLRVLAQQLHADSGKILDANALDIEAGKINSMPDATLDRILLTETRIQAMVDAIYDLIELPDPIGEVLEVIEKENGLKIHKKRVPLGVIGMIYEARPNVTIDAATLALKTNNAVLLRGSSSAIHSNKAIVASIQTALLKADFPQDAVLLIEDTSRETAKTLFTLNEYLDVLIPRGGKKLIDLVVREASVPVLETGAGNCHIFIDESAQLDMVQSIIINAKTQRPSVCNAVESLLIHEAFLAAHGKDLLQTLFDAQIEIYGDETIQALDPCILPATEDLYAEEFLRLAMSIKVVAKVQEAIDHIQQFGTKHSEAIITENASNAAQFLQQVDAAAVYHNASTRFTDGFEFGYGAEIGISTQKLHARGPMGLPALTSTKYFIYGTGQVRE